MLTGDGSTLPTVSLTATDSSASEVGPDNGTFTITRSGSTALSLTVYYSMGGTASNGTDYNSISGSATIPAGSTATTVTIVPKTDSLAEGTETVVLTLSPYSAYQIGLPSSAAVSIADAAAPSPSGTGPYISVRSYDSSAS